MTRNLSVADQRKELEMSEQNKQLVRDFWATLGSGNFDKMASIYDENVLYHGVAGEERSGRAAAVEFAQGYKTAFPDISAEVEQLVAEGDFVVSRVHVQGTNTGPLMGMPATNKKLDFKWVMNMVRISDGKIVEEWEMWDQADFMKQLGLA